MSEKKQELKDLETQLNDLIAQHREANKLAGIHVLEHCWSQYNDEATRIGLEIRDLLGKRNDLLKEIEAANRPRTKMRQCCYICTGLDENICVPHSKGCEAVVRYPKSCGETCRDFDLDEDFAEQEGIELQN